MMHNAHASANGSAHSTCSNALARHGSSNVGTNARITCTQDDEPENNHTQKQNNAQESTVVHLLKQHVAD